MSHSTLLQVRGNQVSFHKRSLHAILEGMQEKLVPPLTSEDCIGLLSLGLAAKFLHAHISPGPLSFHVLAYQDTVAFRAVLEACPTRALEAGFLAPPHLLWYPGKPFRFSPIDRFWDWQLTSYFPAINLHRRSALEPGEYDRSRMLAFQHYEIVRNNAIKPDVKEIAWCIRKVTADNLNEAFDSDQVPDRLLSAYAEFFGSKVLQPGTEFQLLTGGRLTFRPESFSEAINAAFGTGAGYFGIKSHDRPRTASDEDAESAGGWLRSLEPEAAGCLAETRMYEEEIRELRELLEKHDLLREALDAICQQPLTEEGVERVDDVRRVARLAQKSCAPALRAALVYEWSRRGQEGRHAHWTQAAVAASYGVTLRQVQLQEPRARELLSSAGAA